MGIRKMLRVGSLPSRRSASRREKLASVFFIVATITLVWIQGTSGENQPNLTSVETWGDTQIKVTWEPFEHVQSGKPQHYELYIDGHLEYFGNDLMYVARRLTPDTIYHFKLRSCIDDRNKCSLFSSTLSGTTARSQKHSFVKSFFQWTILWTFVTILASTTAIIGIKISRKLWRSFLYRYDYRSETDLGLPKYLTTLNNIDGDAPLLSTQTPSETDKANMVSPIFQQNSRNENYTCQRELHEKQFSSLDEGNQLHACLELSKTTNRNEKSELYLSTQTGVTEQEHSNSKKHSRSEDQFSNATESKHKDLLQNKEVFENKAISNSNVSMSVDNSQKVGLKIEHFSMNEGFSKTADVFQKSSHFKNEPHCKNRENSSEFYSQDCIPVSKLKAPQCTPENGEDKVSETKQTSPKATRVRSLPDKKGGSHEDGMKPQAEPVEKNQNTINAIEHFIPASRANKGEIVVVVDNSNIFIGAQECASLLNPKERRRNVRVKIQQLVKVLERGRNVSRAFVQGSSPPTTEQVWEVYRHLGYCVDLEDRRGKDEQRVDEGLHLNIYKALHELSPRTLVIASGDGNKGKSEGATSLPGCAQAALEKGWLVEVHSWKHSLSTEWLKFSRKYPTLLTIHYMDRYINHITFADGKHGRRCEPFPTDFFKRSL